MWASLPLGSNPIDQQTRVEEYYAIKHILFLSWCWVDFGCTRGTKNYPIWKAITISNNHKHLQNYSSMNKRCLHKREGRRMLCNQVHCISISMSLSRFWMYTEDKELPNLKWPSPFQTMMNIHKRFINEWKMPSLTWGSKNVMQSSALYFYLDVE